MATILCLDPGTVHTGIAISEEGILVTPLTTIFEKNLDKLIGLLTPIIARYHPETIVIGQPEYGPLLHTTKILGEKLKDIFSGEIVYFREDLSSYAARRVMKEQHKTLIKRKKEEHQTAAALILQDYLDSL